MNLTIEEIKKIVDESPDFGRLYNLRSKKYYAGGNMLKNDVRISDLRLKLDQHYYGQSEEKELEQYKYLVQERDGLEVLRDVDIPHNTIIIDK